MGHNRTYLLLGGKLDAIGHLHARRLELGATLHSARDDIVRRFGGYALPITCCHQAMSNTRTLPMSDRNPLLPAAASMLDVWDERSYTLSGGTLCKLRGACGGGGRCQLWCVLVAVRTPARRSQSWGSHTAEFCQLQHRIGSGTPYTLLTHQTVYEGLRVARQAECACKPAHPGQRLPARFQGNECLLFFTGATCHAAACALPIQQPGYGLGLSSALLLLRPALGARRRARAASRSARSFSISSLDSACVRAAGAAGAPRDDGGGERLRPPDRWRESAQKAGVTAR